MWREHPGEGHLVSMDNPSRLFSPELVRALDQLPAGDRQSLVVELDSYFQRLWLVLETFEPEVDEGRYKEQDPPPGYRLHAEGDPVSGKLIVALEATPLRWRLDLAMALYLYLTVDLEFPEDV